MARELFSSALLCALRSFKAGDFRPGDPAGPTVVLVENVDYRRIEEAAGEGGASPHAFLR